MSSEQKNASASDMGKAGILSLNDLQYMMAPDLSVAVSRTVTSQFFQNLQGSPGSTSICIWNTGSSYVNADQSFLVLDVKNTTTTSTGANTSCTFGVGSGGSALNLINRVTITTRSGQVIEKIDRCNQLASIRMLYEHDSEYRESIGSAFGSNLRGGNPDAVWNTGETRRFCIPLGMLSPLMGSITTLLPAQLCSGLRFELVFETALNAMTTLNASDVPSYVVVNQRFQTESYLLSDLVQRSLNEQSASSGLEVVGVTAHNTIGGRSGSNQRNLDIAKAVSRALTFHYKERDAVASTPNSDHFKSLDQQANRLIEFQSRVGSMYFPQSSLRGDTALEIVPELYVQTLRAFGKWSSKNKFSSDVGVSNYIVGSAVVSQDLERSSVTQLSGIPLSNSRTLQINATYATSKTTDGDCFLLYATLIRCFSSNVVVEI
jgi:hypothetical protein